MNDLKCALGWHQWTIGKEIEISRKNGDTIFNELFHVVLLIFGGLIAFLSIFVIAFFILTILSLIFPIDAPPLGATTLITLGSVASSYLLLKGSKFSPKRGRCIYKDEVCTNCHKTSLAATKHHEKTALRREQYRQQRDAQLDAKYAAKNVLREESQAWQQAQKEK